MKPVRPATRILAGYALVWLAAGSCAWFVALDRGAPGARVTLYLVLVVLAGVLWSVETLRQTMLRRRLESVEIALAGDASSAGGPVRFTVRLRARKSVTVSRVVATLSCVTIPRDRGELPAVLHREETLLGENVHVTPDRPAELPATLPAPAETPPGCRLQLDAVVFIGSRPARRASVAPPARASEYSG